MFEDSVDRVVNRVKSEISAWILLHFIEPRGGGKDNNFYRRNEDAKRLDLPVEWTKVTMLNSPNKVRIPKRRARCDENSV